MNSKKKLNVKINLLYLFYKKKLSGILILFGFLIGNGFLNLQLKYARTFLRSYGKGPKPKILGNELIIKMI